MKIVVTGATGNVGTSILEALSEEDEVEEIIGVARRVPGRDFPRTRFVAADITRADLGSIFAGADAVVHLAWLIDSSRARRELGWEPQDNALEALRELIDGMRGGSDYPTPPLARATSGPLRVRELLTGVGARNP